MIDYIMKQMTHHNDRLYYETNDLPTTMIDYIMKQMTHHNDRLYYETNDSP